MKKVFSTAIIGLLVFSMFSILSITPVSAAVDEYFIYSQFDPPGINDVTAAGGYVEYYGVPEWGDEIQYVYFLSGNIGYKVKVWVTDGDGDGKIEPRQHPNHYLSEYQGSIEPRHFQIVSSKDLTGYTYGSGGHTEEFYVDSSGVYLGAYPYGINKWDHDWNYIGKIANSPPERCESMAYNPAENTWYAGGRYRTIYQLSDTDKDGSFLDESWVAIFTYPSYGGDHHDGMEYVGGYLWISDMTSDVIGKWQYNPSTGNWEELKRFTYTEPGDVEGMGFGPNDHFWVGSGWGDSSYIYELGNEITRGYPMADAGRDVDNRPPIIPVKFDASGSHHTDPAKQIILYEWDFESDGIWDYSGTDLIVQHAYPAYYNPDGTINWEKTAKDYVATLRVTDNSDPPLKAMDTCIVHITTPPWPPVADPNGPYDGWVDTPLQLDGSKSYDPESTMFPSDHPWYETIAKYEWDFDYDGLKFDVDYSDVKPTCTWTWHSERKYIVALRVTDSQPSGSGGTIGPKDVSDIRYTTVTIKKTEAWSFAIITDLHIGGLLGRYDIPIVGRYRERDYSSPCWDTDESGPEYVTTERLRKAVGIINDNVIKYNTAFVVVLGDFTDSAEISEFNKAKEILHDLKVPWIPVIGNHDVHPFSSTSGEWSRDTSGRYFNNAFESQYEELYHKFPNFTKAPVPAHGLYLQNFAFDYRGYHFIFLDWNSRTLLLESPWVCTAAELHDFEGGTWDWFKNHFDNYWNRGDENTIIFSHHPMRFAPNIGKIGDGFSWGDYIKIGKYINEGNYQGNIWANFAGHTHDNHDDYQEFAGYHTVETEANIEKVTVRVVEFYPDGTKDWSTLLEEERVDWPRISSDWRKDKLQIGDILYDIDASGGVGHVGIYVGNGEVVEARLEGVRRYSIETWDYPHRENVYILRVRCSAEIRIAAASFAEAQISKAYDGNWRQKNSDPNSPSWYCSELVWAAYMNQGVNIEHNPDRGAVIPYEILIDDDTFCVGGHVIEVDFPRWAEVGTRWYVRGIGIISYSPVDLIVTDPDGLIISKELAEIPEAIYVEDDLNGDESVDDFVAIPERKIGDYLISVVPEPNAGSTDIYTLEVWIGNITIVLAENVQICNIPTQPYIVRSTETEVIPIIPATADFDPDALNLKSKGQWVTVYIELPVGHGYDVNMINLTSVTLNGQVYAEAKPFEIGDYDSDGIPDLMVKFNRAAVQAILQVGDKVEITISGKLIDDRLFEGKDTIQVILPP